MLIESATGIFTGSKYRERQIFETNGFQDTVWNQKIQSTNLYLRDILKILEFTDLLDFEI